MTYKRILVIDDEEAIREMVRDLLESEDFVVSTAKNSTEALEMVKKSPPDLIILDVRFPTIGGIEVCRILKNDEKTKYIPVMMLTVQSSETDKVIGLEVGADDYVIKPFSKRELVARVRALLRRAEMAKERFKKRVLISKPIKMDLNTYEVTVNGKEVKLRPKEFELLKLFLEREGELLERKFLSETVLGYEFFGKARTIDAHIKNLRKKLGRAGKKIETIVGIGYRLKKT